MGYRVHHQHRGSAAAGPREGRRQTRRLDDHNWLRNQQNLAATAALEFALEPPKKTTIVSRTEMIKSLPENPAVISEATSVRPHCRVGLKSRALACSRSVVGRGSLGP